MMFKKRVRYSLDPLPWLWSPHLPIHSQMQPATSSTLRAAALGLTVGVAVVGVLALAQASVVAPAGTTLFTTQALPVARPSQVATTWAGMQAHAPVTNSPPSCSSHPSPVLPTPAISQAPPSSTPSAPFSRLLHPFSALVLHNSIWFHRPLHER